MKNYAASQELWDHTRHYHETTLEFLDATIGIATADFHPVSEVPNIPEGQIRDTAVMDLINSVQLKYTGADVSAAALFKSDSNIKKKGTYPLTTFSISINIPTPWWQWK